MGYRVPTDVTQLLPLIGFFGTVFGLSLGLYGSFLVQGDPTTRGFASAIAIAFDNTLLGLALTIILFSMTSVVRKADETIGLRLEAIGNRFVQDLCFTEPAATPEEELQERLDSLAKSVDELRRLQPKTMEQIAAITDMLTDTINSAYRYLAVVVDQMQTNVTQTDKRFQQLIVEVGALRARVEAAVDNIKTSITSGNDQLIKGLDEALEERNQRLTNALSDVLLQPRRIIVEDMPRSAASARFSADEMGVHRRPNGE